MTNVSGEPKPQRPLLVIDDDGDMRSSMRDLLQDAGYRVVCVANGEEAFRYLRQNPRPAGILLDLFMPVMNGWQFVRAVRAQAHLTTVPIILVTGQAPHWGYPVPNVVKKPIDGDELLRRVEQLVRTDPGIAA